MSDNRIIPISDEQTKLAGCFGAWGLDTCR
jgi:hypothetical protein